MVTNSNIESESETEFESKYNSYGDFMSLYVEGFMTKLFSNGILNDIDAEQLQKYFSSPDDYQKEIENISMYFYISNAEVFQMLDLVKSLPSLKYKIRTFDKNSKYEKSLSIINKYLFKIKHKTLSRDILSQLTTSGTLVGIWLGDKKNIYPYIFDNLKYIYPAYRRNGEWVAVIDLSWFSTFTEWEREIQLANFSSFLSKEDYDKYSADIANKGLRYKELPQDRTFVLRTHTLKRNQRMGIGWATTGLLDITHKNKLKNMEKSVANKIINAIAVLTIGDADHLPENTNLKLPKAVKQKVHSGVKAALEKNQKNGVTVVSIPDFANLEFPDLNSEGLNPEKFTSINTDIDSSFGLSSAIKNGSGANFASAKLNAETFYKRIGVLLEDIETEVYCKLFNLILSSSDKDNYYLEYDKSMPLTLKEKVDFLSKLHVQEGFSLKAVIDLIDSVEFSEYLEQSFYEQEELNLPNRIKPYASAYTGGASEDNGRPSNDEATNENTIKTQNNDGNSLPSA
ncbi:hypothetical protein BSK59_13015 [Paenibacillus odorifer]|nr:hypothetical protein BSK59_13015 [Paenibacillus odorifer]